MDWSLIAQYVPTYVQAGLLTLRISAWGILFALIVGIFCAIVTQLRIPVLRQVVAVYIELSRGTPLLIQLFLLYFALPKIGIRFSSEMCAIIGLAFLGGSYMSEAFRSGFESIADIQRESAQVLGLSRLQTMSYIVIPQALSTSIPGLVANVIFLIKESSVVSSIALADLMYETRDLMGNDYGTAEPLFMLVIAYAIILLPISIIGTLLERRFDYARR